MELKNKRVMIASPIRNREEILPEYFNSVKNIEWDKDFIELFWVINNSNQKTIDLFDNFMDENKKSYSFLRYNVINFENPTDINADRTGKDLYRCFENLAILRNMILDMAKERGVDYLLFWDSDILVEPHFLKTLISHDLD